MKTVLYQSEAPFSNGAQSGGFYGFNEGSVCSKPDSGVWATLAMVAWLAMEELKLDRWAASSSLWQDEQSNTCN